MTLYSTLLGGTGVLTKSCVSSRVFYGSMRLVGWGVGTTAARGVNHSGQSTCLRGAAKKANLTAANGLDRVEDKGTDSDGVAALPKGSFIAYNYDSGGSPELSFQSLAAAAC